MKGFYIVGGYPDRDKFRECLFAVAERGFDFIEVGIPFSEPVADGPVIADAIHEAVEKGVNIDEIMNDMREMKEKYPDIKAIVMTYANIFTGYGEKAFTEKFSDILDGVIIPDIPMRMQSWARERGLGIPAVPFVTPVSRLADIEALRGTDAPFIYYISIMGTTGSDVERKNADNGITAGEVIGKPVVTGFGIRTPEDAKRALESTGGFVIGTEVVKRQGDIAEFKRYIDQFR
ncbi:tryptophan synthase, alpha subunit [Denitrovibrio acetiphilus DSM 12809]|uniref:tryptophan synthase n=1 Tax=Denitrovibrio acetiphilus (strain DSM 12809 / NBRC 114555 / N2460) TaxID=522772 RepID=D4H7F1_DENA2|nr:tryptophan synthase subunit alpha [Denitrovibrio acetiphilus]ADD67950.1 tryptophan synthase, alpha subunit [Denitrovibrio acetiphilus DSM 12809]